MAPAPGTIPFPNAPVLVPVWPEIVVPFQSTRRARSADRYRCVSVQAGSPVRVDRQARLSRWHRAGNEARDHVMAGHPQARADAEEKAARASEDSLLAPGRKISPTCALLRPVRNPAAHAGFLPLGDLLPLANSS